MKRMKAMFFWLTLCLLVPRLDVAGQESGSDASQATGKTKMEEQLQNLHDGYLIVRLTSNHRKMKEMQRLANSSQVKPSLRKRLERQLKELKTETEKENRELADAFLQKYDFSEVRLMYDTAAATLKKGVKNGYFLNAALEVDPAISIDDRPFYVVHYGTTSGSQKITGLVIMDQNFEDLQKPFPYYVRRHFLFYTTWKKTPKGKVKTSRWTKTTTFFKKPTLTFLVEVLNGTLRYHYEKSG